MSENNNQVYQDVDVLRILFVCMGNYCRSPAAEGIFLDLVKKEGLESKIDCESAGTIAFAVGEKPDPRARKEAKKRGIVLKSFCRQFDEVNDFDDFDYIIAMDEDNYKDLEYLDSKGTNHGKIHHLSEFCEKFAEKSVPDPYYGDPEMFEYVFEMLVDGAQGLLRRIKEELNLESERD